MFPVQRYEFYKNKVIYLTVFMGNAYCSFHDREGMSEYDAKQSFHREHSREVTELIKQKLAKELSTQHSN